MTTEVRKFLAVLALAIAISFLGTSGVAQGALGDLDCDGCVTNDDVGPFVMALVAPDEYLTMWDCIDSADMNQDSFVDGLDIALFVEAQLAPPACGACCDAVGGCIMATEADCTGDWQGEGTVCAPNLCPQLGACCDAVGGCTETLEADCTGDWQGAETVCDPNPCSQLGACCLTDDSCVADTTLDDCETGSSGTWQGLGTGCDPNPCVGVPSPTSTQLAGNSLTEYPYFEYVKAFNENVALKLAIDPTRYPEIVGETCDIYVVLAKTAGQWLGDPSLVDARPGGAQTETFGGTTIQDNTFTVADPYDLDSAVYEESTGDFTGLGAAYDMVIDVNQDGQLSTGDYIDGFSREAGLYVVHDTSEQGPLAVTELASYSVGAVFGIVSSKTYENTYYPSIIASLGQLPLIVVSHGNGHDYTWYDHIGYHMASYGYIVMSHQNNTGPGIEEASVTTLGHTDAFLDQLDTIGGGALEGHVDADRIVWIGHSRGAEGVARAFDRIFDSDYTHGAVPPTNYSIDSIQLIDSMLPVDFLGPTKSNPHWANYHLWTASGDADVSGTAGSDVAQTFHIHERATHYRQSTVVQGTGHGDFHASSGSVFTGPCHIVPKDEVHDIMQGLFLPMIKHYVEGNIPGMDFLWRQYERFSPIGVDTTNPCVVVSHEYRNGAEDGNFMIDDYQSETSTGTSSSGGSVTYTVQNLVEGRLDDNNSSFSWTTSDPFNGATQCRTGGTPDNSKGVVFDWNNQDLYYEQEVIEEQRDLSNDLYLSFRGAQGTQHPYTMAVLGDLTFSVTLRDGVGTTSSINIGAYGGGFEQPYARSGGWHNEMEVIRIRITDFLNNGSGLDLTDIVAVRLDVGPSWGSDEGRIVVDEFMLTNDYPPFFVPLTMSLTSPAPQFLPPSVPTVLEVEILQGSDGIIPGSALLHYRYDGGTWLTTPLEEVSPGGDLYEGTLPAPSCSDTPEFYVSVEGSVTGVVYDPTTAPAIPYSAFVGVYVGTFSDDFETDQGWTVENDASLTSGWWEREVPIADPGEDYEAPLSDYDDSGSGRCYLTENAWKRDVDWGPTRLVSPTIDLSTNIDPVLRYARWWANDDQDYDPMVVEVSNDNGGTWHEIETVTNVQPGWVEQAVYITNYVTPLTDQMKIRFSVIDGIYPLPPPDNNNSKDEGGIDAVEIFEVMCSD